MTICSYDNSGAIKFDVDIEMEQGYWNTSQSRLWTRIRDLFHDELVEKYNNMRQNGLSYESFMRYFYGQQISVIPHSYYNKDSDVKYLPYASEYLGKLHGNGYEHLKRWLKNRIIFTDTLFDYAPSYTNDMLTIRANTTNPMTITIETYTPVYQHISFYNGNMHKEKINKGSSFTFTGNAQTATDQEVLIYGGSNIKRITGLSSMNPNSMLIGNATRLVELDISNSPLLTEINSNKANLSAHTYLSKLNLSNCPRLGGALRVNNSPLLRDINIKGTLIDTLQLPSSIRNLETLRLPTTITGLTLNDASLLNTLEFENKNNLQTLSMINCNNLTETINFDLTKVPTVSLDNSYNVKELYMSETNNLTLKNMSNLERLIYVPNTEYDTFLMERLLVGGNYKVTTFNCPKLTDFITTAPHRLSYNNGEYGEIKPDTVFMANSLDLQDTQFINVKLLCTTDLNKLMLPVTVKNFYCDSAFDLDTEVITDGEYDIIHNELIEPYTTDYIGNVTRTQYNSKTYTSQNRSLFILGAIYLGGSISQTSSSWYPNGGMTDFIPIKPNSSISTTNNSVYYSGIAYYDSSKTFIGGIQATSSNGTVSATLPSNARYIKLSNTSTDVMDAIYTYTKQYTPNIIPSSSDGSLIYKMYAPKLIAEPNSGIWDLTGLKFDNFHTFGMNNDVKPSEDSFGFIDITKRYKIANLRYTGGNPSGFTFNTFPNEVSISPIVLPPNTTKMKITTSNSSMIAYFWSTDYNPNSNTYTSTTWGNILKESGTTWDITEGKRVALLTFRSAPEWFELTLNNTTVIRYYLNNMEQVTGIPFDNIVTCVQFPQLMHYLMTPVKKFNGATSITMPCRSSSYKVQIKNANITPIDYNTMLYPLLVDTTLPITGKLDYSKYNGEYLSWAFAYTTNDVNRIPLDSREMGQIKYDYNKLYGTPYVDATDTWIYKDTDMSTWTTNSNITKAYIELTSSNYKTRVDQVLKYFPNCTDLYLFEDGSVTSLSTMFFESGNPTYKNQIKNITFVNGYFGNLTNLSNTFREMNNLLTVSNLPSNLKDMMRTFYNSNKLTNIQGDIPNGVTTFWECFHGCESLNQQLDFSNLTTIPNFQSVFRGCKNLTYPPILPNGITNLTETFSLCAKLPTTPNIPSTVTVMQGTFFACTSLTQITNIPNSVINLESAFYGCNKLLKVTPSIPSSVRNLNSTFLNCSSLVTTPNMANGVTNMTNTFQNCRAITSVPTLPNTVTNMQGTFSDCSSLTVTPTIPNSVTNMQGTFKGCSNLITVTNIPSGITDLYQTFAECTNLINVPNIPSSVINLYQTFINCKSLVVAPSIPQGSIKELYGTFNGCAKLVTVPTLPQGITSLYCTFLGCTSLQTIPNIPSTVTNMQQTFQGCTKLVTPPVTPANVTTMNNCYNGCTSLTTAPNIPNSCTNIASYITNCSKITSATIPLNIIGGNISYYSNAITGCTLLTNITWVGTRNSDFSLVSLGNPYTYTETDIHELMEHLGTVTSATLTLGATNLAYLSEEEIRTATNKGWTLI